MKITSTVNFVQMTAFTYKHIEDKSKSVVIAKVTASAVQEKGERIRN